MVRLFLTFFVTAALFWAVNTAFAGDFDAKACAGAVHNQIAGLNIPENQLGRISIRSKERLDSIGTHIDGVEGWVRLKDCSGTLIIELTQTCQIRQTYLRGECAMLDLTTY